MSTTFRRLAAALCFGFVITVVSIVAMSMVQSRLVPAQHVGRLRSTQSSASVAPTNVRSRRRVRSGLAGVYQRRRHEAQAGQLQ